MIGCIQSIAPPHAAPGCIMCKKYKFSCNWGCFTNDGQIANVRAVSCCLASHCILSAVNNDQWLVTCPCIHLECECEDLQLPLPARSECCW